jgi:hypothetical protein
MFLIDLSMPLKSNVLKCQHWFCSVSVIQWMLGLLLLIASGSVGAMYSFPAVTGAPMPLGCAGSAGVYTCTGLINIQDQVQFLDSGNVSITVNGTLNIGAYRIGSAAQAANVTFYSNGVVTLNTTTLYATISAGSNALTVYGASYIRGNLLVSNGAINAAGTIQGDVSSSGFGAIFMAQDAVVNGNVAGRSGPVTLSRAVAVNGMLSTTSGSINLSGFNTITGGVGCDGCYMFVNGQSNALSGNVSVGNLDGGSSQNSAYYGLINVQAGYLTLGNGTTVQGNVSVTASGLVHASMTIYQTVIQGSVNVRSDIDSVVSLYSGSTINGSVQVTNTNALTASINNNVFIDSQSVINNTVTVTGGIDNFGRITGCAKSSANNVFAIKLEFNSSTAGVCCANSGSCSQTSCVWNPFSYVVRKCTTLAAKFNCIDPSVANPNAATGHLFTQVANNLFNVDVVALAADNSVSNDFVAVGEANKTVEVKLIDCGDPALLINQSCGGTKIDISTQSITFSHTDAGRKSFSTTVSNAYKNVRCQVTDANATQQVSVSTDNFAVRPASFNSVSSSNANADATNGSSAVNAPAIKAGSGKFNMTVTTGLSNYNGTPKVASNPIIAHTGAARSGTLSGVFGQANSGASTGLDFSYDEVGYFKFNALGIYDDTFTQVDGAVGDCTSGFVANNNKQACQFGYAPAASQYMGRFVPDHFLVSSGLLVRNACGTVGYFDQDTNTLPGVATTFTLAAQNAGNTTTQNFSAAFATGFDLLNLNNYHFSLSPQVGAALGVSTASPGLSGSWALGMATVTAKLKVSRPTAPVTPQSMSIAVQPEYVDAGVTISSTPTTLASGLAYRYGKLALLNAHGSELLSLPLQVEAQYWNGSAYVRNAADNCTAIPLLSVVLKNYKRNLNACETRLTAGAAMNRGVLGMLLTAPGVGNSGSVDVEVNLGATASADKTCISPLEVPAISGVLPWFGDVDPVARATFGIYKTPVVYMRESF